MFDVAILGGGSAGYAAARTAAAEHCTYWVARTNGGTPRTSAKLKTVIIEGGSELGGLCILRGCMPSKTLLYAAEVLHLARSARTWGLRIPKVGFNFKAVMARKRAMIEEFAQDRRASLTSGDFRLIRANATFLDPHTVVLTRAGKDAPKIIQAKHFVICTGSVVAPATVPGLAETGYWTSDDALSLRALPRSLIVLGGGPVGIELAQFLARFDVKVTLIQRGPHILRECDEDAATVVEKVLRREGLRIWTGANLIRAFGRKGRKGVVFEQGGQTRRVMADEILFALGRVPATAGLALEKAGVEMDNGRIISNAAMQTSARHIYAAGDCTGPHEIVHIAVEQGEIAAHNIIHPEQPRKLDDRLLVNVVFSDPQVGVAGLTEKEARARGIPYKAASYPFADHGKSLIMEAKDGFVKLLADPISGEILGGACVGPSGGDLIHEIVAAMRMRMTARDLALMPHYHPTLAEIWTYPAATLAGL